MSRRIKLLFVLFGLLLFLLGACTDSAYYLQAARGQYAILEKRQPIAELLSGTTIDSQRKAELARILQIRDFATTQLALPDNASYRSYVELDRPYPIWNVVAAPALSLKPKTWCFPIAGCVSYRGYFSKSAAKSFAQSLQDENYDTLVAGVPAYSTLSWFDDPVLSSFSHWPAASIARLIFHELAHQQLYLTGDSAFNEAFATSVGIAGTRLWLSQYGSAEERRQFAIQLEREVAFVNWTNSLRQQLADLYASSLSDQEKLTRKNNLFAAAHLQYQALKNSWGGYGGYDNWVKTLNNARLASLQTYRRLLPAFNRLFEENQRNFSRYYQACKELSKKSTEQRRQFLASLQPTPQPTTRENP
ncbi:aminopeptidase [Geopsychrobacter electrodiphilus]|uniref:aminopeptidase n=1 Tax=Geopsychrobacter electrodiphilus TaxID=225196 RepID=UPI00037E3D18|nr:aminopeptidase [Geopsychrobacter electrodiphilus]